MTLKKPAQAHGPLEPLIFKIRGHRIMLDTDLARIYGVTTSVLNQAIKRNIGRFPSDFAFQLTESEATFLRSQFVISKGQTSGNRSQFVIGSQKHRDPRALPWAFTEHGVLMAANILRSEKAAEMSVYVVRAFVRLRQRMLESEVMARRLAEVENTLRQHDESLLDIYYKLEPLLQPPPEEESNRRMGFQKD